MQWPYPLSSPSPWLRPFLSEPLSLSPPFFHKHHQTVHFFKKIKHKFYFKFNIKGKTITHYCICTVNVCFLLNIFHFKQNIYLIQLKLKIYFAYNFFSNLFDSEKEYFCWKYISPSTNQFSRNISDFIWPTYQFLLRTTYILGVTWIHPVYFWPPLRPPAGSWWDLGIPPSLAPDSPVPCSSSFLASRGSWLAALSPLHQRRKLSTHDDLKLNKFGSTISKA